ncbi:MAG: invasion associated locus B family protein [Pseudomonadota bacterium]
MICAKPTLRPLGRALAGLAALLAIGLTPLAGQAQNAAQQSTPGPTFQDWQIVCQNTTPPTCGAVQEVKTGDGRLALLAAFGFFRPDNPMIMLLRLPYGLTDPPSTFRVATGLALSIDGREVAKVPIEVCGPALCQSGILMNDQLIDAMKAGGQMTVSLQLGNGAQADMAVSLSGFTASHNELTRNRS